MHNRFSTSYNQSDNNTMLYGGPLGTYLSGIYQPVKPNLTSKSPSSRHGSFRGSTASTPSSSNSSLYYTPQPRRRTDLPTSSSISNYSDALNSSRSSTRPRSYYNSSPSKSYHSPSPNNNSSSSNNVTQPYSSRPTSMIIRNNPTSTSPYKSSNYTSRINKENEQSELDNTPVNSLDYKKLYEEEKGKTSLLKQEINEVERELDKIKNQLNADANNKLKEINAGSDFDLKEMEKLRGEGDKLKAEHRALSRVVARLSREQ